MSIENRDPQPTYNRGEDWNSTIGDIEQECARALTLGNVHSLLDAIMLIKYLCNKTQTDEVE